MYNCICLPVWEGLDFRAFYFKGPVYLDDLCFDKSILSGKIFNKEFENLRNIHIESKRGSADIRLIHDLPKYISEILQHASTNVYFYCLEDSEDTE